jgi:hypothetical protein
MLLITSNFNTFSSSFFFNQIFVQSVLWSKWVKKYKCFSEYENDIKIELDDSSNELSYKNICLKVMRRQSEKVLLKYKQLLLTKINNFTRQIDLKTLLNDAKIVNFELIFYDKSMNQLYKSSNYKLSPFDMCSSICWSNFDDLISPDIIKQIETMRIYSKISLFLQIANNKVLKPFSSISNSKSNTITKRSILYEYKINLRNFETPSTNEKLFSNSMINLYLCDKELIVALWNTNDAVSIIKTYLFNFIHSYNLKIKNCAFMTYNLTYTNDLVNKIFSFDYDIEQEKKFKETLKKSNLKDLELDPKFGLHDYFVYFSFRNQTNTVVLTHSVDLFKTRFDYCSHFNSMFFYILLIYSSHFSIC